VDENTDAPRAHRVIALVSPDAAACDLGGRVQVVRVNSGYEAAAELLAGPASALLADLGRITETHTPLLALAEQLEVPVVGFGVLCANLAAERLADVRLVSAEAVAAGLAEILQLAPAEADSPGLYEPADTKSSDEPEMTYGPQPAPGEAVAPAGPAVEIPAQPAEALTRAELDALLGDSP